MDAQDIFKKLSRGAVFAKRKTTNIPNSSGQPNPISKPRQNDIKPIPETTASKTSVKKTPSQDDAPINLLGSITSTSIAEKKRGKKRKSEGMTDAELEKKRKRIEKEKISEYRNQLRISVAGKGVPPPCKQFMAMELDDDLKTNIESLGYTSPTPIQQQAIPAMLLGKQILACAPTGSGKTAAFILPILQHLGKPAKELIRALIICPTRELATQIYKECIRLSGARDFKIKMIKHKRNLEIERCDILITTPNRLCFLLKEDVVDKINLCNVQWLVIDEVDRLFEESFKDQITLILNECTHQQRKIAMFSATWTIAVKSWCQKNLKGVVHVTVGERNISTNLVGQSLQYVGNEHGKLIAFRELIKIGLPPPVLVFVQSKERAQELFSELVYDEINVDAIHADRTQAQRDNTVRAFREGKIWVLICTELMSRGIDFRGVNLVINYDFPTSAISYVHRVGRAGRAGHPGKAITFFTKNDTINLRSIAHILQTNGCEVPVYMTKLAKRSKAARRALKKKAPDRESIITLPYDERKKKVKRVMDETEKKRMTKRKFSGKKIVNDVTINK